MDERLPGSEFNAEELLLIQDLRTNYPEAMTRLIRWQEAQEREAGGDARARAKFELKRARIYLAAGFKEDASIACDDVMRMAEGEDLPDLFEEAARLKDIIGEPDPDAPPET